MTTQQPEALRLADALAERVSLTATGFGFDADLAYAAAELRRLHAESEQHLQELAAYRFTVENLRARVAELETQLAKVTHPAQQGVDPIEQRQLAIGQAVERACKELPEGAEIQIYLERGAGTVHMTDWDGNEFDHFDEAHNDFACRINAATDGAIAAEKVAAQAKQGEQTNG